MQVATPGPPPYMHRLGWVPRRQEVIKILDSCLFFKIAHIICSLTIHHDLVVYRIIICNSLFCLGFWGWWSFS